MSIYEGLINKQETLALVGLGYVGMPIAVEFSKHINVVGFDINKKKIEAYKNGIDPTKEVGDEVIKSCGVKWTYDETRLRDCKFIIVAVPTPVDENNIPDLNPVTSSSEIVGRNLNKGSIVVYESTVYPGVTEEICVPILEKESGLKCGADFKVGYSPERINPGDTDHRLKNIKKIVSGMDEETLEEVANVYSIVVEAGVHKASSIKVAEAAKVIENSQRDINIAFMNELSMIFNKMDIDTLEVLEAASTKWNFLPFRPGLVGGHCIGVDPYYLTYRAKQFGYKSQVILSGRRINDSMGKYVAEQTVKQLLQNNINIKNCRLGILGISFKEDCPDVRNSKVNDIIKELKEYGIDPIVCDPIADKDDTLKFYNVELKDMNELNNLDCLIIAVSHKCFKELDIDSMMKHKVLIDIKGIKNKQEYINSGYSYWRL